MGHSWEGREMARNTIASLASQATHRIRQVDLRARKEAERICEARRRARGIQSKGGFGVGLSGETKELREVYEHLRTLQMILIEPELRVFRSKIERTIKFFGFNDIEINF